MPSHRTCLLKCTGSTSFFSFPNAETDGARRKEWLRLLGVEEPQLKNVFACQKHFSNYMRSENRLMHNAVPDINVRDIVKYGQIFRSDKTFLQITDDEIEDIIEYDPEEMSEKNDHTYATQTHCEIADPPESSILLPDIDPDVVEILDSAGINPYTGRVKTESLLAHSPAAIPSDKNTLNLIDESTLAATNCAVIKTSPVLLFAPSSSENSCEAMEEYHPLSEKEPADYHDLLCSEKMPEEFDQKQPLGVKVGRWVQTCDRLSDRSPRKMKLLDQIFELQKQLREQEREIKETRREEGFLRKYISKFNETTEKKQIVLFCKKLPTEIAISVRKTLKKNEDGLKKEARKKEKVIRKKKNKEKTEKRKAEKILKRSSMKKSKTEKKRKKQSEEKAEVVDSSEEYQAVFHILADVNL